MYCLKEVPKGTEDHTVVCRAGSVYLPLGNLPWTGVLVVILKLFAKFITQEHVPRDNNFVTEQGTDTKALGWGLHLTGNTELLPPSGQKEGDQQKSVSALGIFLQLRMVVVGCPGL